MHVHPWLLAETSWLDRFSASDLTLVAFLALVALLTVVVFGTALAIAIHHRSTDVALKRDMLERGMSAEEIERVLAAKTPKK